MKRLLTVILSLFVATALFAQSPEAILKSIEQNPNIVITIGSTYPGAPSVEVAQAPKGFKPFYLSLLGRHGSRSETRENLTCRDLIKILDKAEELGILTEEGKALHKLVGEIWKIQQRGNGEISALGFKQWEEIATRAYNRFGEIFRNGSVEAKSSNSLRCVLSMASFNQAIKGLCPKVEIFQNSRKSELGIVRPFADDKNLSQKVKDIWNEHFAKGEWKEKREAFLHSCDGSSFVSKITTNRDALINECGAKSDMYIAYLASYTLLFAENFEMSNRDMVARLFTTKELYNVYVYNTAMWVNTMLGRGNEYAELRQSTMRILANDILDKAQAAIDGKNPHVANLRFTHDSYVGPFLSALGYDGCVPQWNENFEKATTSFNHATVSPMAANLQIALYRNKKGEVLVRSLVNERDGYLPIECETAPFYPWDDFCKHVNKNFDHLEAVQAQVLKKYND
jgi:hypothetical protein